MTLSYAATTLFAAAGPEVAGHLSHLGRAQAIRDHPTSDRAYSSRE